MTFVFIRRRLFNAITEPNCQWNRTVERTQLVVMQCACAHDTYNRSTIVPYTPQRQSFSLSITPRSLSFVKNYSYCSSIRLRTQAHLFALDLSFHFFKFTWLMRFNTYPWIMAYNPICVIVKQSSGESRIYLFINDNKVKTNHRLPINLLNVQILLFPWSKSNRKVHDETVSFRAIVTRSNYIGVKQTNNSDNAPDF